MFMHHLLCTSKCLEETKYDMHRWLVILDRFCVKVMQGKFDINRKYLMLSCLGVPISHAVWYTWYLHIQVLNNLLNFKKWMSFWSNLKSVKQYIIPMVATLRLHYNSVLYNADSIITRSPHGSQIFSQYNMCENISRRSRYTQCKLWKSYSLCIS